MSTLAAVRGGVDVWLTISALQRNTEVLKRPLQSEYFYVLECIMFTAKLHFAIISILIILAS